jgi:hypothetical protein
VTDKLEDIAEGLCEYASDQFADVSEGYRVRYGNKNTKKAILEALQSVQSQTAIEGWNEAINKALERIGDRLHFVTAQNLEDDRVSCLVIRDMVESLKKEPK